MKAEAQVHLARADEVLKVAGEILRLGVNLTSEPNFSSKNLFQA